MTGSSQDTRASDDLTARKGLGLGMDISIGPPPDPENWKRCPDCDVWSKGKDRLACANCGYVFGQEKSDVPAAALDEASLRAARNLLQITGSVENARIALDQAARRGI